MQSWIFVVHLQSWLLSRLASSSLPTQFRLLWKLLADPPQVTYFAAPANYSLLSPFSSHSTTFSTLPHLVFVPAGLLITLKKAHDQIQKQFLGKEMEKIL